jgi:hypothetical protein
VVDVLCISLNKCEVGFLTDYIAKITILFKLLPKRFKAACQIKLIIKVYVVKNLILIRLTIVLNNFVNL